MLPLLAPARRASTHHSPQALPSSAAPIAVLPLGEVSPEELRFLDQLLGAAFAAETVVLPPAQLPDDAFSTSREQFDADRILDELFARAPERCLRIVGVIEKDLYVVGRTFVFGYAHLSDGVAVYSTARFSEGRYGRPRDVGVQRARVCRAVVHELGHTFGNQHCNDRHCVMHPVTQIETLDALAPWYCARCHPRVADGLQVAPWSGRGRWERGLAFFRRRELRKAVEMLEGATRAAPLEPRYFNDLAAARLATGDREGARAAFRRASELTAEMPSTSAAAAGASDSDIPRM